MSIEAKLEALTKSVDALTDITTKLHSLRADAIESVRGAATKPAAEKPAKAAEKPAAEKETVEVDESEMTEVQKVIAAYTAADGISEAEIKARKAKVKEVLAHPKVNAKKVSDIPANLEGAVIKAVNKLIAEGNLIKEDEDDEDLV